MVLPCIKTSATTPIPSQPAAGVAADKPTGYRLPPLLSGRLARVGGTGHYLPWSISVTTGEVMATFSPLPEWILEPSSASSTTGDVMATFSPPSLLPGAVLLPKMNPAICPCPALYQSGTSRKLCSLCNSISALMPAALWHSCLADCHKCRTADAPSRCLPPATGKRAALH